MKNVFKIIFLVGVLAFLFLYVSYKNGYYIKKKEENTILTEEKIKEYENDLKNGVDVSKKNYITVRNNYDSAYSRILLKLSRTVENGFDKTIKFVFRRISKTINE